MLLRNTNHKRNVTTKFASLCVVINMAISAFCFPSDFINFLDEDTNNYSSETGEIERFASDCVITITRTSEQENTTDASSESETNENTNTDESSTEENKDDALPENPEEFDYLFESEPVVTKIAFEKTDDKAMLASKLKALELLSKNLSLQTQKTENKDVIEVQLMEE